jgi:DNA integrity scanning protein DisA with diadenylate cyclase activity
LIVLPRPDRSDFNSFSIHSDEVPSYEYKSDIFLRIAMSILPITAVLSYQMDAIWQLQYSNMYAGLSSTILHIFYFLQFYTHLKCQSRTITMIYTYLYHIIIWIFKVRISRVEKRTEN